MKGLNKYYLKLTTLSPVHIGTGDVYEPTNFVIDDGWLYEFDEVLFFKNLPQITKTEFNRIVNTNSDNGNELFEKLHAFIIKHKETAKKVAFNTVKVSSSLETHYKNSIAKKVQVEGKGRSSRSVFNKFEIQKTQRLVNKVATFLTGSSIKGAISTAYQEYIYKNSNKKELLKLFNEDKLFRNLSISDSVAQKADSMIGYAVNKERFETEDDAQISTFIEVNKTGSEYLVEISIKDLKNDDNQIISETITKEKIIQACNSHYKPLYEEKMQKAELSPQQFLITIGKHSGARAVTIAGLRKILVKLAQISNKRDEGDDSEKRIERLYKKSHFENKHIKELLANFNLLDEKEQKKWKDAKNFLENPKELEWLVSQNKRVTINAILKEETTLWKFSENKQGGKAEPFGWVLCEFIDVDEYEKQLKDFRKNGDEFINEKRKSLNEIKQAIKKVEEEAKEKALQKQKAKEEEQQRLKKEQEEKEAKLASMSPLDRKIEELRDSNQNPNETIDIVIFNALKSGKLDEFKCDALKRLKEEMRKLKKWVESSKKPEKDKKYKRTIEVLKMLKECE